MNEYLNAVLKEKDRLDKMVERLEKSLSKAPEGKLRIGRSHGKVQYYIRKDKGKADADTKASDQTKNKEEFEAMKKKTRNILFGMIAAVVAAVAGIAIFKATR